MVDPASITLALQNVTNTLPVVTDMMIYVANFMVTNFVGTLLLCMSLAAFGWGLITGLFRRRRGRGR